EAADFHFLTWKIRMFDLLPIHKAIDLLLGEESQRVHIISPALFVALLLFFLVLVLFAFLRLLLGGLHFYRRHPPEARGIRPATIMIIGPFRKAPFATR